MREQHGPTIQHVLWVLLLTVFSQSLAMAVVVERSEDWVLQKDQEGIRVYTRDTEYSDFDAFRGEIEVESTLNEVVAILTDVPNHRKWMKDISEAEMVDEFDPDGYHSYGRTDAPWPVTDRDWVVRWEIRTGNDRPGVVVTFKKADGVRPPTNDAVRTGEFEGFWHLEALDEGGTRVVYEVSHADPGGMLPAWLVNAFVVNQPYYTLSAMRRELQEQQYQNHSFSFL